MKSVSRLATLFIMTTILAGMFIFISHMNRMESVHPWPLLVLCMLASLALILKVEGTTERSHYTFSLMIYGFTLAAFGATEAIVVILVSHFVEWAWNRPPWAIQLFNTGIYLLAMQAAGMLYIWINQGSSPDTWRAAPAILFGMAAFNGVKHMMCGIYMWLTRGENFRKSGVFDFFPLLMDLSLLYFGASMAIVWNYNPFAMILFVIPTYLLYSALRVPALERKTEIDSKTGLFNHSYFSKQLENELARSKRFDRPLAVIIADLDLLRNINNTYGHLAGDEVLIGLAKLMKHAVRDYDVVCRFGGEEFAILMPETTLSQAYQRAELIRRTIESMEFVVPTSRTPIRATMSLGVAHRENFRQTSEEIVHQADLALYQSKLSGRNRTFAIANQAYLDFPLQDSNSAPKTRLEEPAAGPPSHISEAVLFLPDFQALARGLPTAREPTEHPGRNQATLFFSGLLAAVSLFILGGLLFLIRDAEYTRAVDWFGLFILSVLIVLLEGFSIELYTPQSAVSTSAIPVLAVFLLFGPVGTIWASLFVAVCLVIKHRHPVDRFALHLASYLLAGTGTLGLVWWAGGRFEEMAYPSQIFICLVAALLLYFITTWMVAGFRSLEQRQSILLLWQEQFSGLAPYHAGIGLITFAMIIGYRYEPATGLLIMAIPLVFLRINQKRFMDRTRVMVAELREKNQILNKHSREIFDLNEGLLTTLSEIIDHRDARVPGHSKKVSRYAVETARLLGLGEKQIELIRKAGLLHDIGKLGVPAEILSKPGKLTIDEYSLIREHAVLGGELVRNSPSLRPLGSIIRHHHEFYDGGGYPDGLAGNKISLEARIIAVADAIEAMTSDRPYRRALPLEQVIEELKKYSGTQFDPIAVQASVKMLQGLIETQNGLSG